MKLGASIFLAGLLALKLSTSTTSAWVAAVGMGLGKLVIEAGIGLGIEIGVSKLIDQVSNIDSSRESNEELWLAEAGSQIQRIELIQSNRHFADYTTNSITDNLEQSIPIMAKLKDIHDIIDDISTRYQWMQIYGETKRFENFTLIKFAEDSHSAIQQMDRMHVTLLGSEGRAFVTPNNLLVQLATKLKGSTYHICKSQQSAQQFFYLLHEDIALTELKAHAMMEFSWLLLKQFGKGSFTEEKRVIREALQLRTNRTQRMFRDVINRADRAIWRCDPTYHKQGVTYEEVTRLLQGYIENEVDLSPGGYCRYTCEDYNYASNQGCYYNMFCSQQPRCSGRVYNCHFVEANMEVCQAARGSTRRYEFVHYKSGHRLGQWDSCARSRDKANSWRRWLFWQCSYCMCLCDEQGPKSDRYFNLRPVTADIGHNRVVTGLRFAKRNRILHLQIQEGELLPRGVINQTTLQWKPVDEYSITDRNVRQSVDYHMLTYDRRSIDLNELTPLNNSYLITGLRFQNVGGNLHLQGQYSAFEFQSGKLIKPSEQSYWESGATVNGRVQLPLQNTHMSTKTTASSTVFSSHNQYIDFTNTGFEQDVAQTTVPFIDIQEVVSSPPVPLAGIGIYYKGRPGYGGFIGPKIVNFDFSPYL